MDIATYLSNLHTSSQGYYNSMNIENMAQLHDTFLETCFSIHDQPINMEKYALEKHYRTLIPVNNQLSFSFNRGDFNCPE